MKVEDDDVAEARRKLVALELRSTGFRTVPSLESDLAHELSRAIYAPVHENEQRPYGAVIISDEYRFYCLHDDVKVEEDISPSVVNRLADGVNAFVLKGPRVSRPSLLLPHTPLVDEVDLFTLRDDALFGDRSIHPIDPPEHDFMIVRRDSSDAVTALASTGIATLRLGSWGFRRYQYAYMSAIRDVYAPPDPMFNQCIRAALRLAVHILSPKRCGGTIVVLDPTDDIEALESEGCVNRRKAVTIEGGVDIARKSLQRPLVHLMSQHDGATIVNSSGDVTDIGVWLGSRADGFASAPSEGGTRHFAAQRFSREIAGVVIVVSSDGPVTIFFAGDKISVSEHSCWAG